MSDIVERLEKLTAAQRDVLSRMGEGPSLRNFDEVEPLWWIEGRGSIRSKTAEALVRKGFVKFTDHWGGQPGVYGFSITPAGRRALAQGEK